MKLSIIERQPLTTMYRVGIYDTDTFRIEEVQRNIGSKSTALNKAKMIADKLGIIVREYSCGYVTEVKL